MMSTGTESLETVPEFQPHRKGDLTRITPSEGPHVRPISSSSMMALHTTS